MPEIPVLGRLRQEHHCEFQASLGYVNEFRAILDYKVRLPEKKKHILF